MDSNDLSLQWITKQHPCNSNEEQQKNKTRTKLDKLERH